MRYNLAKACDDCPFRREGGVRLMPERAEAIARMMLDRDGGTFTCHKTTVEVEDDDGNSERVDGPNAAHCAGAMIFAEKNGNATQMMRIAERFNSDGKGYDATKLVGHDEIFDDLDEMLAAQITRRRVRRRGGTVNRRRA